jgi:hypothetical protein
MFVALGISPHVQCWRGGGGGGQETAARCVRRHSQNACKRVILINNPVTPAVTVLVADVAVCPIVFFKIPVATGAVDT